MSQLSDTVLLEDHLKRLRLPAMLRDYPECVRQAREEGESYEGFLLDLATRELTQRQANQLKRRLKEARFPVMKTLEGTDFKKWPGLEALQVRELLRCDYIPRRENLAEDFGCGISMGVHSLCDILKPRFVLSIPNSNSIFQLRLINFTYEPSFPPRTE